MLLLNNNSEVCAHSDKSSRDECSLLVQEKKWMQNIWQRQCQPVDNKWACVVMSLQTPPAKYIFAFDNPAAFSVKHAVKSVALKPLCNTLNARYHLRQQQTDAFGIYWVFALTTVSH